MPYEDMDIKQDWGFSPEEGTQEVLPLTLDEAFAADKWINSIEDLAEVTQKMDNKAAYGDKPENFVIIAGQKFKRDEVELWMVDQEFINDEEDGQNSPDAELERTMQAFKVTRYVSLGDLVNTLKWSGMDSQTLLAGSPPLSEEMLEVLWHMGLNTKDYAVVELTDSHRDANEKAVTCLRFISQERMDKEWLQSGMATFEAKLEASGDESLLREIKIMGR